MNRPTVALKVLELLFQILLKNPLLESFLK